MTRMNWEKARQRDQMRRFGSEPIRKKQFQVKPKRATDKQIALIFKHKMVDSIRTDMSIDDATIIISAFAEKNGWNNAR